MTTRLVPAINPPQSCCPLRIVHVLVVPVAPIGGVVMIGEKKERWTELCYLATVEQDTEKLLEIVREINRLLDEKEQRLRAKRSRGQEE